MGQAHFHAINSEIPINIIENVPVPFFIYKVYPFNASAPPTISLSSFVIAA